MPSLAILPGTFDPITMGHIDLAERAVKIFDKIIIAIGVNPYKVTLFNPEERMDMIKQALSEHNDKIIVDTFDGLLVDYAASVKAKQLTERPDNDTLLRLYALYKQGADGDVSGARPGMFDFVGGAKYDAWAKLKGTAPDEAKQKYIDLVKKLAG